jgi:uncharacterized protein YebE (UPF0316 family)
VALLFLCIKIFFARITDVTLATLRTVYSVKGKTLLAGLIGFIEATIWFIVVKEALNTNIESPFIVMSYAGGFATGSILGTFVSKRFVNSLIKVEVITSKATPDNVEKIRLEGFGVSVLDIMDNTDDVDKKMLIITLNSKHLEELKRILRHIDRNAFVVVNESKIVQNGFIKK